MTSGRGFTLVEVITSMALGGLVAAVAIGALVGQRRAWWELMWRTDGHATARMAQMVIAAELRGTVGDSGISGITHLTAGTVVYRAVRSLHFVCSPASPGDSVLTVWNDAIGSRRPDPAVDSLLLLQTDPLNAWGWRPAGLRAVRSGTCGDGRPSLSLQMTGPVAFPVDIGTPVRAFETAEIRAYRSGSAWWIGMRRSGNSGRWPSIQPAFGPITTRGLEMVAFDSAQTPVVSARGSVGVEFRVGLRHPFRRRTNSWFSMIVRQRNGP